MAPTTAAESAARVHILAGDIGGTKSELGLYERDASGAWTERARQRFASAEFTEAAELAHAFLGAGTAAPDAIGFAVAGPVHAGMCHITNLGWELDSRALAEGLGAPVALMNDFAASALGIPELSATDLVTLQTGETDRNGPIALFGAGTGLGHAIAVPSASGWHVLPGEGGHSDFAPHDDTEIALWRFLRTKYGAPVSIERAVSGPGLIALWEFVIADGLAPERASLRAEMAAGDAAALVTRHALDASDPACMKAFSMFLSLYGAEAGNFALKVLPAGGLYVTGGIAPQIIDRLRDGEFLAAFLGKDRMGATLARIPVHVVMNPHLGLLGARALAVQTLTQRRD